VDDNLKQALLNRFSAYLDNAGDQPEVPDDAGETADLYSVFVEMAGLRSEVRTESRMVKEALDQFRGVFDLLRTSQATVQQELDRARADAREQAHAVLRPLLLDVIDLRTGWSRPCSWALRDARTGLTGCCAETRRAGQSGSRACG
jgi:molecular chaperone GrpE